MDDEYWAAYRKRARRRANAFGALIFCPFIIVIAVLAYTGPVNHQVDDIRDNMAFRFVVYGLFLTLGVAGLIGSVRWLLADRRRG
jgi:ABC-type transport system involved in multi-copper enzyme maturation permease subunit